jgi:hypothetical protein
MAMSEREQSLYFCGALHVVTRNTPYVRDALGARTIKQFPKRSNKDAQKLEQRQAILTNRRENGERKKP